MTLPLKSLSLWLDFIWNWRPLRLVLSHWLVFCDGHFVLLFLGEILSERGYKILASRFVLEKKNENGYYSLKKETYCNILNSLCLTWCGRWAMEKTCINEWQEVCGTWKIMHICMITWTDEWFTFAYVWQAFLIKDMMWVASDPAFFNCSPQRSSHHVM